MDLHHKSQGIWENVWSPFKNSDVRSGIIFYYRNKCLFFCETILTICWNNKTLGNCSIPKIGASLSSKRGKKRLIRQCSTRYCKKNQKTNPKDRKVLYIYIGIMTMQDWLSHLSFFFLLSGRIMKLKFTAALLVLQLSTKFIIAYSSNIWDWNL